jgi:hypothetical protein
VNSKVKKCNYILYQIFLSFGDIKQVCWLSSKERAVKAMLFNYEVVVNQLEHDFVAGSRADDANKDKGYHTVIKVLFSTSIFSKNCVQYLPVPCFFELRKVDDCSFNVIIHFND